AIIMDAVFHVIGVTGMAWPVFILDVGIIPGTLIVVFDQKHDRRAGRNLHARFFIDENTRHDFHRVRFLALGREAGLPGPPAVQFALDVFPGERNARRTAIHHAANYRPMAFAKARKPEEMTESVERHDDSAPVGFRNARSAAGQLNGKQGWEFAICASPWLADSPLTRSALNGHSHR